MFGKSFEDRRKHPRLHVYHLVKYKVISGDTEGRTILASLADIGGGGICLRSQENLAIGSLVQISINMPQLAQPVTSIAKVVWSKKIRSADMYESGLQFVDIEDMLRNQITSRVDDVYKKDE